MMDYMFSSTPKKTSSLRPASQIQTNVIPELYLCRSNRLPVSRHESMGDDIFDLSHLDYSPRVHNFISEDRTEMSSWTQVCQPEKEPCRSSPAMKYQDVETSGTFSKTRLKPQSQKFSISTPTVNITVQQPFLGHKQVADFRSSCVSDSSKHSRPDLPSPMHSSARSGSWFLNDGPGSGRHLEDVSFTDSSHRSPRNRLHSRESGYHSISLPYQRHQQKTSGLHLNHARFGIDSSCHCSDEPEDCEITHWSCSSEKRKETAYPGHAKKKKDYRNRQEQTKIPTKLSSSRTSAERAIRLIDLLYHTDSTTSYNNIILARWFKQWHNNVKTIITKRQAVSAKLYCAYSIEHTVMLKKYLALWRKRYQANVNMTKAADLHRFHMAKKALMALKWAVWRGILEQEAAVSTRITALIRRHFALWKQKFDRRQEAKWQLKFSSWQRDSELRIRCHQFEHDYRERIMLWKAFSVWKTAMHETLKSRKADRHYRRRIFGEVVHNWHHMAVHRRVKRLQKHRAKNTSDRKVMIQVFYKWHMLFMDRKDAVAFNRRVLLTRAWRVWRYRYSNLVTNLKMSIQVADQFRALSLCLTTLNTWRQRLLEVKAYHIYKLKTMRNCWLHWKQHFWIKSYRRAQSEKLQKLNVLLTLKLNALVSRQSSGAACCIIETVMTQIAFGRWLDYFHGRKEERFAMKRQEKLLKTESLKKLGQEMQIISGYLKLKWAYNVWLQRKQIKAEHDAAMIKAVRCDIETRQKRRTWTAWTDFIQRNRYKKSLTASVKRGRLRQAFAGWRRVAICKQKCLNQLKRRGHQTTLTAFLTWRILFLSRIQTRECEKIWSKTLLKTFFHCWVSKFSLRRKKLLKRAFVKWRNYCQQIHFKVDKAKRLFQMKKCFNILQVYTVRHQKKRELSGIARQRLQHKTLSRWKFSLQEKRLISTQHKILKPEDYSDIPLINSGQEVQHKVQMNSLKRSWETWVQLFLKTRVSNLFHADKLYKRYFHTWSTSMKKQMKVERKLAEKFHTTHQVRNAFEKWQLQSIGLEDHYLKMKRYQYHRAPLILKHYWGLWRKSMVQSIALRKADSFIKRKAFYGWRKWTTEKTDRVMRCRALQRAIENRRLKHLFEFWKRCYFCQRLMVSYEDGLLMTRAFDTWDSMVAHLNLLEHLSSMFVTTQHKALAWKALVTWRDSLHWNQILSQSRCLLEHQTRLHMKRAAFLRWKQQWLFVLAGNHNNNGHIKRYFNKWKAQMDSAKSKHSHD